MEKEQVKGFDIEKAISDAFGECKPLIEKEALEMEERALQEAYRRLGNAHSRECEALSKLVDAKNEVNCFSMGYRTTNEAQKAEACELLVTAHIEEWAARCELRDAMLEYDEAACRVDMLEQGCCCPVCGEPIELN